MSQITTVVRDLQLSKKIEETELGSTEAEKSRYWGLNVIGKFKNLELKGWGNGSSRPSWSKATVVSLSTRLTRCLSLR